MTLLAERERQREDMREVMMRLSAEDLIRNGHMNHHFD